MTLKIWVTEGNEVWLIHKSREGFMKPPELIVRCLNRLHHIITRGKKTPKLVTEFPKTRPVRITIGLTKQEWDKVEGLCTTLKLGKTQLVFTAIRNFSQNIVDEELNFRAHYRATLPPEEPI